MKPAMESRRVVILLVACLWPVPGLAIDTERPDVAAFVDDMVNKHAYDRRALESALTAAASKAFSMPSAARPRKP